LVEIVDLVKDYGTHRAVDNLNLTIEDGQIYGFLGPNGAGKSTTMNMMCGYIGATSGDVKINGHSISEEPLEAKKLIGYLPEIPPVYPDMTPEEYLDFAAGIKRIPKAERKEAIELAIKKARIENVRNRLIKNLSKGYRQRVGLAQAILGLPPLIILDEPTVGLDPKQIIEMRELIKELGKEHTVILSSHILSEVSAVCDKVMIISAGKLVASDTTENLERKLKAYNKIQLTVRGNKRQAQNAVERLNSEYAVTYHEDTAHNECTMVVSTDQDKDIRDELFLAFSGAHLPIIGMQSAASSLEEVFLELTQDGSTGINMDNNIITDNIDNDGEDAE